MEETNKSTVASSETVTPAGTETTVHSANTTSTPANNSSMKWMVAGIVTLIILLVAVAAGAVIMSNNKKDKDDNKNTTQDSNNNNEDEEESDEDTDVEEDEETSNNEDESDNEDNTNTSSEEGFYEASTFSIEYPTDWYFTESGVDKMIATSIDADLDAQDYLKEGKSYAMLMAYTSAGDADAWEEIKDGNCELFSEDIVDGFISGFNGSTSGSAVDELSASDIDVEIDSTTLDKNPACKFSFTFPLTSSELENEVDITMDIYMIINKNDKEDDLYAVGAASFGEPDEQFEVAQDYVKTFQIK